MPLSLPFTGVDRRTAWVRGVLLSACFLGLIASAPVWFNARAFPLFPIAPWFLILPPPWDKCLFAAMLLALVLAGWFYRTAVIFFLSASLFAFCQDQNRGQPWLYMYWVMLLLTLVPAPASIAACRAAISVAYLWSGIQKCNARFFKVVPEWFIAPAANWHLPAGIINLFRWGVAATPFIELAIGLALWPGRLRRPAIATVLVLHAAALLFLGPTGHNYNWVVWPWNLAMIGLVCALFATDRPRNAEFPAQESRSSRREEAHSIPSEVSQSLLTSAATTLMGTAVAACRWVPSFLRHRVFAPPDGLLKRTAADLWHSKPAVAVIALYSLLPILSYAGKWDSDFSFSLYSENQAVANVFVTQTFADRLPPGLRRYVQPFSPAYDPQRQGPFIFGFQAWCYEELHVPPIPEPRHYRAVFQFLRAFADKPEDLRMIVGPRAGPVVFYQGDSMEFLTPQK